MKSLQIGDVIEVLFTSWNQWYRETIINMDDISITTQDLFHRKQKIKRSSLTIAPLNTYTINISHLKPPSSSSSRIAPKPIYNKHNNTILITIATNNRMYGIQQYDITNNNYKDLNKFNSAPLTNTQSLNEKDNYIQYKHVILALR